MRGVWAGDVKFVGREPFRFLENPNHTHILVDCVAKDIGYDSSAVLAQRRQLFRNEGAHTDILQADGS